MKSKLVIIDGNAVLHRAWHAFPPLTTKDGRVVSAAYGFTVMLLKAIKDLEPTHVAVTFDLPGGTFRHKAFEAYKAHRVKQPDELYAQIPMVKDILKALRIPVYEMAGFEADDVIGTLSKLTPKEAQVIIVTGDRDTLQLVDERVHVYTQRKGMSDTVIYDPAAVRDRYGLEPGQLIDFKALVGDPSDNLPGLKGIGEKGATLLLQKYGTIEGIFEAVKKSPNDFKPRALDTLQRGEKDVPLSKKLVTIVRDLPIDFDYKDAEVERPDTEALRRIFVDLEFKTLVPKVENLFGKAQKDEKVAKPVTVEPETSEKKPKRKEKAVSTEMFSQEKAADFAAAFAGAEAVAYRFAYENDDRIDPKYAGVSLTDGKRCVALAFSGAIPTPVAGLFADASIRKIGHDVKFDLVALASSGIEARGVFDDVMLMSYLQNPGSRAHALSDLIFEQTGAAPTAQATLFPEDRLKGICQEAAAIWKASVTLSKGLEKEQLLKLYEEMERPLAPVLGAAERHGVKIDSVFLAKMAKTMQKRIETSTKAIIDAAGEEFNISSPLQLQRILFEKLGLPTKGIKKTSTGQLSTGADELEKLREAHPIIERISEYREYTKLLSTYVVAIPEMVHPKTGRLHARFNQAVTATGRLSSSDPNLQNIPIRTELGREIRKAFIADKGNVIIAADYSQIELRIAASISGDKNLIEAFRSGEDIHTSTAARIWEIEPSKVTFEQRRAAKAINFGILYGMGANSLAASAGVPRAEASQFIERYLKVYSSLREYMESAKSQARELGYVETMFGRRRYLPEINSGVPYLRAEAERMAINMPIQGTNADIIKLAMVRLHDRIGKEYGFGRDAALKMIIQVHDELVFECEKSLAPKAGVLIREAMAGVFELQVPIDIEVEVGPNWGELDTL